MKYQKNKYLTEIVREKLTKIKGKLTFKYSFILILLFESSLSFLVYRSSEIICQIPKVVINTGKIPTSQETH